MEVLGGTALGFSMVSCTRMVFCSMVSVSDFNWADGSVSGDGGGVRGLVLGGGDVSGGGLTSGFGAKRRVKPVVVVVVVAASLIG